MSGVLYGIFVGGRATRMGGAPKGLLPSPDTGEALVVRLARLCRSTGWGDVVLVGDAAPYASLGFPGIADAPAGVGPIGGLSALLAEAARRGAPDAVALAGDLPYVTIEMVTHIATHAGGALAVAPRIEGRWQPLFARYGVEACAPLVAELAASGRRALHGVLDALRGGAVGLPLTVEEAALLDDWDSPEDRERQAPARGRRQP